MTEKTNTGQTILDRSTSGNTVLTQKGSPGSNEKPISENFNTSVNKAHSEFYNHIIASIKALSNDKTMTVSVGSESQEDLYDVNLPLIENESNKSLTALIRGVGDSFAMMRRYHNTHLHNRIAPSDPTADRLFTLLERERFESVGARQFLGVSANLNKLWALSHSKDTLARLGPTEQLELVLCCLCREHLSNNRLPIDVARFIEPIRGPVEDLLGDHFYKLAQCIEQQQIYANQALTIVGLLGFDISPRQPTQAPGDDTQHQVSNTEGEAQDTEGANADEQDVEPSSNSETVLEVDNNAELSKQPVLVRNNDVSSDKQEQEYVDENDIIETAALTLTRVPNKLASSHYCVFDNSDDQIRKAVSLIEPQKLKALRKELDVHVQRYEPLVGQLAARMQQVLLSRQKRAWQQDLDEGELDPHRLTHIISSPHSSLAYRIQSDYPVRDTAVCLLIDNSRSMLGKPITTAACCADLITRVLDRCGVSTEVLGFTTVTMYGGAVAERWQAQRCPANAGRLNNVRHIIYKSAVDSWQRSRDNFGLMLDKELLKQNIDGEALMWAHQRLLKRPERRRIMMVISDGRPSDSFTIKANNKHYLHDHLDHVVVQIEQRSSVELVAVGIGHQVSHHYRRSFNIDNVEHLGPLLLRELSRLLRCF